VTTAESGAEGKRARVLWRSRGRKLWPFGSSDGAALKLAMKNRKQEGSRSHFVARRGDADVSIELVGGSGSGSDDDDDDDEDAPIAVQRIPLQSIPRPLRNSWPFGGSS
jgi:hypothetical protein